MDTATDKNPWTTLSVVEVYENPWIRITHREVLNPMGRPGIYGVVHFKNLAVGIVPIDENGNTWLVGQYRYALNRYSWEIPEGGCPVGADPLEAAQRELREETGLIASKWTKLLDTAISNSVTDELGVVYLAQGISEEGPPDPEETEELQLRKLPLEEALQMVYSGEITDSLSIMGLMMADKNV